MTTILTVDDLPEEILELVFSKLTIPQRKTVRLVSKHWLKVSSNASLTKEELIKLKLKDLHLFKTPRELLNLEIIDNEAGVLWTDLNDQEEFCVIHGDSVRFLKLKMFDDHFSMFYKVINRCCNIEELSIQFVPGWTDIYNFEADNTALNYLSSLTISGPATMAVTFLNFPKVKRLVFDCAFDCEDLIKALILRHALTLTELVLRHCSLTSDLLVFEQIGPQLTSLHLIGLSLKYLSCFEKHLDKLPNLKQLELSLISRDGIALSQLLNLRQLEYISLNRSDFGDKDLIPLARLGHLKGLDISGTPCTSDGILKCFGIKPLPNLIALKMDALEFLTDDVLAYILPNLPNLKCLSLGNCSKITAVSVSTIVTNCKLLTYLFLRSCSGIKNVGELASIGSLQHLVRFDVSQCWGLDSTSVAKLRFDKLKIIGLIGVRVVEGLFKKLFVQCPRLKRLYSYAIFERLDPGGKILRIPINPGGTFLINLNRPIFDFCK